MKSMMIMLALATSGCFSSWAIGQASGRSLAWDENLREETVPLPGVQERIAIGLPLGPRQLGAEIALSCRSAQHARDAVYRSSFRYGKGWKKATATMFLTEAALATAILLAGDRDQPKTYAYGGFFALDAIGTAALFFAPRKESYRRTEVDTRTPLREDCPDGLTLEIAGNTFAVDAAGRLGDAGEVALDDWMKAPAGALLVGLAGRTTELRVSANDQCTWLRARDPQHACSTTTLTTSASQAREVYAVIEVPVGTLSVVASQ